MASALVSPEIRTSRLLDGYRAGQAEAVQAKLGERHQAEYFGLRPDVLLALFIPRDLWDRYLKSRPATSKIEDFPLPEDRQR
jgi:hypothetical protein